MTNIKEIVLSTGKWLFVQVPIDSHSHELYDNNVIGGKCIMYLRGNPDYACEYSSNLPDGFTYTLIGKASELTEEQWKGIVEMLIEDVKIEWDVLEGWQYGNVYQNYSDEDRPVYTAAESGLSLLLLYGLNPSTTLILKID